MIAENLKRTEERIRMACEKSGRRPEEVTLIAVSKTKPVELLMQAYDAGQRVFGENKVQEILEKYEQLPKDVEWHMIGHLQRNKVKYIIDKVACIHSVDSFRLAETIELEAKKQNRQVSVLIEVNIAGEESKFGVKPEEAEELIREISVLPHIKINGLMTIAPFAENPEENRIMFKKLTKLGVDIDSKNINNVDMNVLSMGMTGDYEIAVQEGATMVRVGTGIFGERIYSI